MLKRLMLSAIILISLMQAQENVNSSYFTGNASFYYISRLDNGDIINMPYRMFNTSWLNQHKNFELLGKVAVEYLPTNNYSYRMDDPQDFLLDLRELYMTWFSEFGEIRMGKQIQSWGFVDENSPLDNSCAYDYNFLFETGTERKIATTSLSADFYYKSLKLGFTTSPFHSINRLPSSRAEFPIELPVIPSDYQFLDIDDVGEYGGYLQLSTDIIDLGVSYFSGYDRIYHFAGINVPETVEGSAFVIPTGEVYIAPDDSLNFDLWVPIGTVVQDTVFSYRKSEVIGIGGVALISDLTLKADLGYFITMGVHDNIERPYYDPPDIFPVLSDNANITVPSKEKAEYYQLTLQLEYELPLGIDLFAQYFQHDTLSYKSNTPLKEGESIIIPAYHDLEIEGFNPYNFFYPGMGSPLAMITHKAILAGISKSFINDRLTLQIRNMMDLEYNGYFLEINTEYDITDRISSSFAVNYISGNDQHPKSMTNMGDDYVKAMDYPLNQMKDYSHYRMQIKYSF